ncbi:MAG: 2-oxoglutarate dehydrogenase E1 component [Alphaproteobacteria bacterium MarineAlpha9_Bin4]|nr:2-oxoglutarate dehydrogenase E1 component [Pelagibacterales bacterium]PPR27045.1 MAG: 2-oxoglutarate dehydrogenase E1 component [Alphaproteobacteria bacterium MarineAlpha9_Bin4]
MSQTSNLDFIKNYYEIFQDNPENLDQEWRVFFEDLDYEACQYLENNDHNSKIREDTKYDTAQLNKTSIEDEYTANSLRARLLIRAYRIAGHLKADLDPLGLSKQKYIPDLDPETYGLKEDAMEKEVFVDGVFGINKIKLKELIEILEKYYCAKIGTQFMHIQDKEQRDWIMNRIENIKPDEIFTDKGKKAILERLTAAEFFENFLDKKYTGTKRFGLEGGESLIPALEQILKYGGKNGIEEVVLGMPHRGRLNVLANFMGKPFSAIFSEFQGNASNPDDVQGSGDVKYHLGTSSDRNFENIKVHLSLTANPSHLEAVNPVVVGKVRAKQDQKKDVDRKKVVGLLMHGDAAFSGQGLVPETLDLSGLKGYKTGGTIHFIVNNQIGFTTSPTFSRSGPYCSDVALMVEAPIFHVNGDDPEAVVYVARIATEFRQKFNKDVVIDMFCYRRQGHNESDEPAFTQPLMYEKIRSHSTTREIYAKKLVNEKVLKTDEVDALWNDWSEKLEKDLEAGKSFKPNKADWLEGSWSGFETKGTIKPNTITGLPIKTLKEFGVKLTELPENFNVNKKVYRVLQRRLKNISDGKDIDWACAESLAFASLLYEGKNVRLSGQDCGRGTFSQRHAILVDQKTEEKFSTLNNFLNNKSRIEIVDSPLSEAAVLGFEYGYTLADPNTLVLWEAQFGDFANGAQLIIDQFIVSGESKWLRMSGITILLPHGYEGQGPEHSSARIERYLQMAAEDNIQVVNCTTPANYFHVLRRQMLRKFRKPLIIFTPKSLLRNKDAVSKLDDMGEKTRFHKIILDGPKKNAKKVVFCSGKIFYEIMSKINKEQAFSTLIIRIEQLYPFPMQILVDIVQDHKEAKFFWCQEEPKNMGAWSFVNPELKNLLSSAKVREQDIEYIGRKKSSSTATGLFKKHLEEQTKIIESLLNY